MLCVLTCVHGGCSQALEKKLRAMEDNLFVMKEFVAEKGAETDVAPHLNEVRGMVFEINSLLSQQLQKAA